MPEPPGELMTREKIERMTSDVTNLWACDKWNLYLFEIVWLKSRLSNTVKLQWLEHLWDHEN